MIAFLPRSNRIFDGLEFLSAQAPVSCYSIHSVVIFCGSYDLLCLLPLIPFAHVLRTVELCNTELRDAPMTIQMARLQE